MSTPPDSRELINTAVRLVPLRAEDAEELFAALDDERVWAGGWGGGPAAAPKTGRTRSLP